MKKPQLEVTAPEPELKTVVEVKAQMTHDAHGNCAITIGAVIMEGAKITPVKSMEEAAMMLAQALFQYQLSVAQAKQMEQQTKSPIMLAPGPMPTIH